MITPDDGKYQHAWLYKQDHYFDFEVRACAGARIRLNSQIHYAGNQAGYEIILGDSDNTKTTLTLQPEGTLLNFINTPDILSCHALRPFRISWTNGHITISRGLQDEGEFFKFYPTDFFPIETVTVSSDKDAGSALWEFATEAGV